MRTTALILIASCGSEIEPLSFPEPSVEEERKPPKVKPPEQPIAPDIAALERWGPPRTPCSGSKACAR